MHAIIRTGGKQYLVAEGTKLKVEKLDGEPGAKVAFEVLMAGDEQVVQVGTPVLGKAMVSGTILSQGLGKKVTGIRHKAKKRELTRYGHRQPYTEVEITKIAVK